MDGVKKEKGKCVFSYSKRGRQGHIVMYLAQHRDVRISADHRVQRNLKAERRVCRVRSGHAGWRNETKRGKPLLTVTASQLRDFG